MNTIRPQELSQKIKEGLFQLWNKEYPLRLHYLDLNELDQYLKGLQALSNTLILGDQEEVIAWYFDFIRNDAKWFGIIIDSTYHGQGIGRNLLTQAKARESELNGWVIDNENELKPNGKKYRSPLGFYLKNGFEVLSDVRLETEKISAVQIQWSNK